MRELERKQSDWFIEYHNLYTAYVILMFDFATGHRSVTNKYCFLYEVDLINGYMLLNEKDGDNYYNDRIVPFPSICCEQFKLYLEYRRKVAGRFNGISDITYVLDKKEKSKSRKKNQKYKFSVLGCFVFLNKNLEVQTITPSRFESVIGEYYSLKLDTNRHCLRTYLRVKNYPGEKIDLILGHWLSGQNPNSRFSTSVSHDILSEVKNLISGKMEEEGWELYKGPANVLY